MGSVAYRVPKREWSTLLVVTKLANKLYMLNNVEVRDIGTASAQPSNPRQVALTLRNDFGRLRRHVPRNRREAAR